MLGQGYKPDWLYNLLPYLYALSGVLLLGLARHPAAQVSGLAMLSAGLIVWLRRKPGRRRGPETSVGPVAGVRARGARRVRLSRVDWQAAYETGNELIDYQHRRLFEHCNHLVSVLAGQPLPGDVELLLDELIDEIDTHFRTEESLLAQQASAHLPRHRQLHQRMQARIQSLRAAQQRGESSIEAFCNVLMQEIVVRHILDEDMLPA